MRVGILHPIQMPSTALCSTHNIILEWLIALRARASLVRNVGLGLSLDSKSKVEKTRKDSEPVAQCQSVERNSSSKLGRPASLKCLYLFSSAAISIDLNCPDRGAILTVVSQKPVSGQRRLTDPWATSRFVETRAFMGGNWGRYIEIVQFACRGGMRPR